MAKYNQLTSLPFKGLTTVIVDCYETHLEAYIKQTRRTSSINALNQRRHSGQRMAKVDSDEEILLPKTSTS